MAPSWVQWLYKINPLAAVITAYRSMLNGTALDWFGLLFAFVLSTAVLAIGAYVFMQKERAMVDVL